MVFLGLDRECRGRGGIQRRRRSLGRVGFHINRCVRRALPTPVGARLTAADTDHAHLSRPPARGSSGRARPAWRADGARVSIGATGEDTLFADTNEGATRIFELWDASDVPELANHSSGGYWVEVRSRATAPAALRRSRATARVSQQAFVGMTRPTTTTPMPPAPAVATSARCACTRFPLSRLGGRRGTRRTTSRIDYCVAGREAAGWRRQRWRGRVQSSQCQHNTVFI